MTTTTVVHGLTPEFETATLYANVCPCGYRSGTLSTEHYPNPQPKPTGCPNDPTVRCLVTLQFSKQFDDYAVHLVRVTNRGTPGPTLCGIDRFPRDANNVPTGPGWSVGGGVSGRGIEHKPCGGCVDTARREFPGLPVSGPTGAREIAAELGVAVKR